ncbi:hypothetical protein BLNAU_10908 [Blattamonas nauphoetae]|uniref:U-box domain-containing protein n=1 Tax=Blattamonas nauphoetae TaxID=2049346 RepID=A0ABQ9XPV8_9EUKA|nr:hypothetical protein BLNAU_10908 [Blattamonas nauphoetae]
MTHFEISFKQFLLHNPLDPLQSTKLIFRQRLEGQSITIFGILNKITPRELEFHILGIPGIQPEQFIFRVRPVHAQTFENLNLFVYRNEYSLTGTMRSLEIPTPQSGVYYNTETWPKITIDMDWNQNQSNLVTNITPSYVWEVCNSITPGRRDNRFDNFWKHCSFDIDGSHVRVLVKADNPLPPQYNQKYFSRITPVIHGNTVGNPLHLDLLIPNTQTGDSFVNAPTENSFYRYHVKPLWLKHDGYYFELVEYYEVTVPAQPLPQQRPWNELTQTPNHTNHPQNIPSQVNYSPPAPASQIPNSSYQQLSAQQNPQTPSHPYIPSQVNYSPPAPVSQPPSTAFQQPLPPQQNHLPPQQSQFQPQQNNFPPQQNHFTPQQSNFQQQSQFQPQQDHFPPQSNLGFHQTPPQTQPQAVLPQHSQQAQISPNPQMSAPQHISPQTPQIPKLSLDEQKAKGYICAYSNQRITTPVTLEGYPNEFYERDVITQYIRENGIHPKEFDTITETIIRPAPEKEAEIRAYFQAFPND